jgi:CHAT domain-containing protein
LERQWRQAGFTTVRIDLSEISGENLLVHVDEQGVGIDLELLDGEGKVVARSGSPVDRSASEWAYVSVGNRSAKILLIKARDARTFEGAVHLIVTGAALPSSAPTADAAPCELATRAWADADAAYATGRAIELGRATASRSRAARDAFEKASRAYQDALARFVGLADPAARGNLELTLSALAYYELQDWSGSAYWAEKSAATFAKTGHVYQRARAQAILAAAWMELATKSATGQQSPAIPTESRTRLKDARVLLRRLARFHSMRNEDFDQALQINNIGLAYYYEARFEAAIPNFLRAMSSFKALGDTTHEGIALQNLALCDWGLGHLSAALNSFDRALALIDPSSNSHLYLLTLNNSGLAHYAAGRLDEALRLQTLALEIATSTQVDRARARSYYGIGVTYYAIGDRQLAAEFLRQALEICTPQLDARIRVATLRALAQTEYDTGHHIEAVAHDSEALHLATAPSARSRIVLRLAEDYAAAGDNTHARELLNDLILRPPQNDKLVYAMARVQRGRLLALTGDFGLAERDLNGGVKLLDRFDAPAECFAALVALARLRAKRGRTAEALGTVRRALDLSREIQDQTANPEYRSSIAESIRPALALEVDLLRSQYEALSQKGRFHEAEALSIGSLEAVDQFRASGFEEWRAEYLEHHSDTHMARLFATSALLYHDIAQRRYQLEVREDRGGSEDARARILREDIARLRVRLGLINTEIAIRSGAGNRRTEFSGTNQRMGARGLALGHALVEYWLGPERAYAWVVHGTDTSWVALSPTETIDKIARSLHDSLRSPSTVPNAVRLERCAELYRLILAPLAGSLQTVQQLTIVPDGALHYTPFAAMRSTEMDNPYLVQRFVVSLAPALRFVRDAEDGSEEQYRKSSSTRMLMVADPIYTSDDSRLTRATLSRFAPRPVQGQYAVLRGSATRSDFTRLASSAREARQIEALYGAGQVDVLQGVNATRDMVLAKDLSSYRFIHIASHGLVDAEIPQLSALILGFYGPNGLVKDPFLRVSDFLNQTFHAQVVVLSACDTALGKKYASEGLIGLQYAALARGAHAVVASLWAVSDGTSADLMTDMYRQLQVKDPRSEGRSSAVAESLAAAMRDMLKQTPTLDPAIWAPFAVYVAGN